MSHFVNMVAVGVSATLGKASTIYSLFIYWIGIVVDTIKYNFKNDLLIDLKMYCL